MKFLCPSCKAKYQIGDEKVAGRSVRMKCRRCGYLISISKAVTEGSVSRKLSSMPPPAAEESKAAPPPRPAGPPPKPAGRTPTPAPARGSWTESARASSSDLHAKPPPRRGAAPPPRPSRPEPVRAPTPRAPAAGAGLAAVPVSPPHAKSGNGASAHGAFEPAREMGDEERTVIAGIGGMAGAFSEHVSGQDASTLASSLASTDEWYVGINGVPVGPIRLSELRSKASAGAITVESLVWRDGFEQWLPLSNFPELVAIVEEGLSSARASLTPFSPPVAPSPPQAPRPEVYDPFAQPSPAPLGASDPFASTVRQEAPQPFAPFGPAAQQPGPFGPVTGTALVTEGPRIDEDEVIPIPTRTGTSPFAWIAVAVALMLGLTIGFVMFNKKPPEPVVQYVTVPATGAQPTLAATGAEDPGTPAGEVEADAGAIAIAKAGGNNPSGKPTTGDKPGEKPLAGLQGLQGLQGSGPVSGPGNTTTAGGSSGQPLSSADIQKTVGKYTSSVRRSCWQPALDARAKDAPTSARVSVSIRVSPSGAVQSASTSGDPKGYPGLASCIASRVRGWQFPPSSGPTTVNVPFVFAAQ